MRGISARLIALSFFAACALQTTGSSPLRAQPLATAPDSLMGVGVSMELARYRAERVRDVGYALSLDVTGRDSAKGSVLVTFTRKAPGDAILDFRGTSLGLITVNGVVLDAKASNSWNRAHVRIPSSLLREGVNQVTIAFVTPIAAAGASIIRTRDATDGAEYLYTLLVPSDANLLFPCFDQPDLKASVALYLRTPPSWSALANGISFNRAIPTPQPDTASSVVHSFGPSGPISTYLIAFAAGPWSVTTRAHKIWTDRYPVPVSLWVRRSRAKEAESDSLIAMNVRALVWLGKWFDTPYPFTKYDALLAPAFPFGGMEHPGAVFYNEESFIYRERPTVSQLLGRQATTFHEVAHQWFGDYVTMKWFDDLWLKEGFATYMAAKMQASLEPSSNAWKTFYLRNKPVAYGTDATAGTTPVWQSLANLDQAKSNYGPIVYNKAPGVLKQLEFFVGEAAFQRGVRDFLRGHAYGNATWRDRLHSIGTAAGRDLTTWGESWILRPGMPIVEQRLDVRGGRIASLRLVQRAAQPALSGSGAWPIATNVVLYYDGAPAVHIPVTIRSDTTVVAAAAGRRAPSFVFANAGDYAYALTLPDSASVSWLERHVETVTDDFLRAMLWGAMWDMVREARLSPHRYANMALRALPREPDEQLASGLIARLGTTLSRYMSPAGRDSMLPVVERLLIATATDTARPYGVRKAGLDAFIALARTLPALTRIERWLHGDTAAGLPLRPPTRWAIVTRLVAQDAHDAMQRLEDESRRDSTTEGRRQAFVAGAAWPNAETKRAYFSRWFADRELNEEWVTSSLRAFHDPDQASLTSAYLVPALDTLPWIQANRRIFFLGSWLGATISGQSSESALRTLDEWLASHPALPADLRQKVLQNRDELERTVRIRRAFP